MEKERLTFKDLKTPIAFAIFSLVLVLIIFNRFIHYVQDRPGVVFGDPVLAFFVPMDLTTPIFYTIYGSTLLGFIILSTRPYRLLMGLQAYFWLVCMRLVTMYTVPLDPPQGIIVLRDPIVELFGNGQILTRDLFFSGHTSLAFLIALVIPYRKWKVLFFFITFTLGMMLMIQRVHYSLDVISAPFFSYCAVRTSDHICSWYVNRFVKK